MKDSYLYILIYPIIFGMFLGGILNLSENSSLPLSIFQLSLIFAFAFAVLNRLVQQDTSYYSAGYFPIILVFMAVISFSLIYSSDQINGTLKLFRFIILCLFIFFLSNVIIEKKSIYRLLVFTAIMGSIISLFSVFEYVLNPEIAIQNFINSGIKIERTDAEGLFSDPNRFAAALILPIAFTFTLSNTGNNTRIKIFALISFVIMMGGVLTTYSRSGLLAILLALIIIIIKTNKTRLLIVLISSFLLMVLLVPSMRYLAISYSERFISLFSGSIDASSNIRIMLAIGAVMIFVNSKMLGTGFESFNVEFRKYFDSLETLGVEESHNIFLTIFSELGLIGGLVFIYIVRMIIIDSKKCIDMSKSNDEREISITLMSSLWGILLFYQFYGDALFDNILMLIIGLSFAMKKILYKE